MQRKNHNRWAIGIGCIIGLACVYLFQRLDIAGSLGVTPGMSRFLVNRTIRFFLNDAFMIGLIYAIFVERKYVVFALWVQLAGIVLFLIPYFVFKVYYPSYNGPMINYLHRLILNPTLLLLLIPAFYYQRAQRGTVQEPPRREDAK